MKLRLFGRKTFSPFVTLGLNSSAINYEYRTTNTNTGIKRNENDTETSNGASFGGGIELNIAPDADLTLSYRRLAHHKQQVHVGSFEFGVSF